MTMASTSAAVIVGLASILAVSTPSAQAQDKPAARDLPTSLSRIRAALKKPEPPRRIMKPPSQADFNVQVLEKQRFSDLLSLIDFGSGPVAPGGWYAYQQRQVLGQQQSQPLFSVDMLSIGSAVGSAVSKARRDRAERLAREEVQRALVDFCAERECPAR